MALQESQLNDIRIILQILNPHWGLRMITYSESDRGTSSIEIDKAGIQLIADFSFVDKSTMIHLKITEIFDTFDRVIFDEPVVSIVEVVEYDGLIKLIPPFMGYQCE